MNTALRIYVFDDEVPALNATLSLVRRVAGADAVAGHTDDLGQAIADINRLRPNLLLLDIEVRNDAGRTTSFELLPRLEDFPYQVVFITAYESYALRAFRIHALDYLLKPVRLKDLEGALGRARERLANPSGTSGLQVAVRDLESAAPGNTVSDYLWLSSSGGYRKVYFRELVALEAQGNCTLFHLEGGDTAAIGKNLREFTGLLSDNFFQIHRSFIINTDFVTSIDTREGDVAVMRNGNRYPIAIRRKQEFLELMNVR